jgi:antitoxin component of MazEF toxin-antitoxin module
MWCTITAMFSKQLSLHQHGGSIMITIPADVVREFQLAKGSKLEMSYHDRKLIIDLDNIQETSNMCESNNERKDTPIGPASPCL